MSEFQEYRDMPQGAIIRDPGKFESCARYAPEIFGITLEGMAYETLDFPDSVVDVVEIDDELRATYPEIQEPFIAVEESEQGFVYCTEISRATLDRLLTELEAQSETADCADWYY